MKKRRKGGYNPLRVPKPDAWLSLDEQRRIDMIETYHIAMNIDLPNVRAHAAFQAIIENQAALRSETPVAAKLKELQREGLDRHEALHAVMYVLSQHFYTTMKEKEAMTNEAYFADVRKLTKQSWYDDFAGDRCTTRRVDRERV